MKSSSDWSSDSLISSNSSSSSLTFLVGFFPTYAPFFADSEMAAAAVVALVVRGVGVAFVEVVAIAATSAGAGCVG